MTGTPATAAGGAITVTDARLRASLDDGPPDIGTLWDLCLYFEFDREETADGIAEWLGPPAGPRVLDCACGGGFPALDLIRRGYDVTCTDGSELMLEHFRRNARVDGITAEPLLVPWEELPRRYAGQFDVVMNRGGGNYMWVGGWDEEGLADRTAMAEAIRQWMACIRPGGRFYVDITRAIDLARREAQVARHPRLLIGDHVVDLTEEVGIDQDTGIRTWHSLLTVDGTHHEFRRRCRRPLQHAELVDILTDYGLVDVRKTAVRGEYYDVYTATRPATESGT